MIRVPVGEQDLADAGGVQAVGLQVVEDPRQALRLAAAGVDQRELLRLAVEDVDVRIALCRG